VGKYLYVFQINMQSVLQRRASLLMDRVGGIATTVALYFFWSSIFSGSQSILGYSPARMLSYVLMTNFLRAVVFTDRGWEVIRDISSGRISNYLLRPIRYAAYCFSMDAAQKTVGAAAAALEIGVLILCFKTPWYVPRQASTWLLFGLAAGMSSLIFFLLEFAVASIAFWTFESGGPLFCFDLTVQFAAGAFFPLDVLPKTFQNILQATPFPYIVFFPLNVYLERLPAGALLRQFSLQAAWLCVIGWIVSRVWRRGLRAYAAEGG